MDQEKALSILKSLGDGIEPATGEAFPASSAYQHPDTVRALFVAIHALEAQAAPKRSASAPAPRSGAGNSGKPWSKEEDELLLSAFDGGQPVETIAQEHGRSKIAIEARLAKFGRMPMPTGMRGAGTPHAAEPQPRYAAHA